MVDLTHMIKAKVSILVKITPNSGYSIIRRYGNLMRRSLIVATIYALLTTIMTWPILGRLSREIPGSDGDAWVHLWT